MACGLTDEIRAASQTLTKSPAATGFSPSSCRMTVLISSRMNLWQVHRERAAGEIRSSGHVVDPVDDHGCWISRYFGIHRVDYHGHPTADGHPRPTFRNHAGVLAAVKGSLALRAATRH
jgi:hypothetical protein